LVDAVQAMSVFEKIGVASTVHRRWFMFLGDSIQIEFLKNGTVCNRQYIANLLAMYRRFGRALFAIFLGRHIADSAPLERQCQERDQIAYKV
jgi:hypothetical protein